MTREPVNLEEIFKLHSEGIKIILGVRMQHTTCYNGNPTTDPKHWDDKCVLVNIDDEATLIEIAEENRSTYERLIEDDLAEKDSFGNKNPTIGKYRFIVDFNGTWSEYCWNYLYENMYHTFAHLGKELPMPKRIEDFFYLKKEKLKVVTSN